MKIQLIDINETFKDMPEISSPRYFHRKSFDSCGLFSEQIFGPVEDFKCQCGKISGQSFANTTCPSCKVLVTNSNVRSINMAKITVPTFTILVNPMVSEILEKFISLSLEFKIDKVINGKDRLVFDELTNTFIKVTAEDESGKTGPMFFQEVIYPFLLKEDPKVQDFDTVYGKYLFINYIPVIPPNIRPISLVNGDSRQFYVDEINEKYATIIRTINNINDSPYIFDKIVEKINCVLQSKFTQLFQTLIKKFEHKSGFLRSHVLGKRIDYSGRAVIVVDGGDLPFGWCKLPFKIAKEVFKPQIITTLAEQLNMNPLQVLNSYDLEEFQDHLLVALKDRFIGYYILINRQPTLHRPSMQSMRIYDIIKDDVIVVHPLITEAYNADKQPSLSAMLVTACKKLLELLESLTR